MNFPRSGQAKLLPAGYETYYNVDPFDDHVGPLGYKVEDGKIYCAFLSRAHHANSGGTLHGGMLMTFADFALCVIATWDQPGEQAVTVSFNGEFVAAGEPGDVVESAGEIVRRTRTLTFVRGQVFVGERVLLNCSAIVKRIPGGKT